VLAICKTSSSTHYKKTARTKVPSALKHPLQKTVNPNHGLQPSHVAQFQYETHTPLAFTPARFNTGTDPNNSKKTSIITVTGPFIITWSMKKVLAGKRDPYTIKRYEKEVMADDFKFGSDKSVIVAVR